MGDSGDREGEGSEGLEGREGAVRREKDLHPPLPRGRSVTPGTEMGGVPPGEEAAVDGYTHKGGRWVGGGGAGGREGGQGPVLLAPEGEGGRPGCYAEIIPVCAHSQ